MKCPKCGEHFYGHRHVNCRKSKASGYDNTAVSSSDDTPFVDFTQDYSSPSVSSPDASSGFEAGGGDFGGAGAGSDF